MNAPLHICAWSMGMRDSWTRFRALDTLRLTVSVI